MSLRIPLYLCALLVCETAFGQGIFWYSNPGARTRIGTLEGPLAGTNIFGQMFAGAQADSLSPLGPVDYHINGLISAGNVTVSNVPPYNYAFAQLAVWDSTLWGPNLSGVPVDQIGRTDIVPVYLGQYFDVIFSPLFTQPAIVPIPEPSVWAVGLVGAAVLWVFHFRRRARSKNQCG